MCAVPRRMIFCSSFILLVPGIFPKLWSIPSLISPSAPTITGTVSVLIPHILVVSISRSLYFYYYYYYYYYYYSTLTIEGTVPFNCFSLHILLISVAVKCLQSYSGNFFNRHHRLVLTTNCTNIYKFQYGKNNNVA